MHKPGHEKSTCEVGWELRHLLTPTGCSVSRLIPTTIEHCFLTFLAKVQNLVLSQR
jgi:hypothetical protein